MRTLIAIIALLACAYAKAYEFSSTKNMTQVLELYTSEGCSSCPPADQWLSSWVDHPDLWQAIIPLAFHVDYWNYIGWTDRFALPAYSDRQRRYQSTGGIRSVYTPGFVLNGKEWRSWFRNRDQNQITPSNATPGILKIDISEPHFSAQFTPDAKSPTQHRSATQLHVALLGFGLNSAITAGENRGEKLQHDFVVLALKHYSTNDKNDQRDKPLAWQGALPARSPLQHQAQRLAWVAWISGPDQQPVQATGGWRQGAEQASTVK